MRILLINDYGAQVGGAETYIINLKKGLEKKGHIVKILTSDALPNKPHFNDYSFKAINQKSIFRIFPYIFNLGSLQKLKIVINDFHPEIIHLNYIFYHTSPSILLGLKNIPTIMTTHSQEIISAVGLNFSKDCKHEFLYSCKKCSGFKYYPEKIKRMLFKKIAKNIDLYISPSKYYKKYFEKNGVEPIIHLYNGFYRKKYLPIQNYNHILYLGRLAKNKGTIYIIQALPIIIKDYPNIRLTIVGSGPEEKKLKETVKKLSLEKNVIFINEIDNNEVANYYKKSTIVVVIPDYPDNLPTVAIEAMSVGRPVVGTKIGGVQELVNDKVTGILVNPQDIKEFANKIIELLKNKDLLDMMSIKSREKSKEFDIVNHVDKIENVYKELLLKKSNN